MHNGVHVSLFPIATSYNYIHTVLQKEYIRLWSHKIWNGLFEDFLFSDNNKAARCENILSYGFFQNWGFNAQQEEKERTNLISFCSDKLFYY